MSRLQDQFQSSTVISGCFELIKFVPACTGPHCACTLSAATDPICKVNFDL